MILQELFDKVEDLGHVAALSEEFHAFKEIGGRRIRFTGGMVKKGHWEVEFAEANPSDDYSRDEETRSRHGMTGKGHEFEVMSFVMSCLKVFISKYKPERIEFHAKSDDESRVSLYRRMLKRYATDYIVREFETGMGRADKFKSFDLIRKSATTNSMETP